MKKYIFMIILCILITTGCSSNSNEKKILHGDLLDFKETCNKYDENDSAKCLNNIAVIKAKIEPSYSNKSTINQNYFNIENFIKKYNGDEYDEIQYWAVANMKNGDESKIISFTVKKDLIKKIKNNTVAANQLENYVDDLWIIPSLK